MRLIYTCRVFVLCATITVAFLATKAFSQGLADQYKLGVNPGDVVAVPQVGTVQGLLIRHNEPTLVIFTMAQECELCIALHHVAAAWQERHPNVQVLLVDTRSAEQQVVEWVQNNNITVPVISDVNNDFGTKFDVNRVPILFFN